MIDQVCKYMKEHNMVLPGSRILVAVSGGADSMCLLEVLRELKTRMKFEIRVLHVHHGLRESADRDLHYVSEFCRKVEIPFKAVRVDAAGYASRNGLSLEEGARSLRYSALEQEAGKWDQEAASGVMKVKKNWETAPEAPQSQNDQGTTHTAPTTPTYHETLSDTNNNHKPQIPHKQPGEFCRIAVAHHVEDQAETVLFNLIRGSRLTGARGMLPVNGRIIRPLLGSSRAEIERFLTERGISWCEDETNEDTTYSRNLLRREVVPMLERINAKACEHIAGTADEVAETEEFLSGETQRALERCLKATNTPSKKSKTTHHCVLDIPSLLEEAPLLQRRVVYTAIAEVMGTRKDLQNVHVQDVLKVVRKSGNGEIFLPGGVRARKVYSELHISATAAGEEIAVEVVSLPQAAQPRTITDTQGQAAQPRTITDTQGQAAQPRTTTVAQGQFSTTLTGPRKPAQSPMPQWPTREEDYSWRFVVFDGDMGAVPRNRCTKWFDYDKIGSFPIFRTRREGDRMTIDAEGRSKSIARYMIDAKVPAEMRGRIVLPTAGQEVLWFPGGRISAAYMVEPSTSRILEITWNSEAQ